MSDIYGIRPRNLTARAAYVVPGNSPLTRLESTVGNCYPGLEYDHRNLDRRFFPGLVFEFVSQEDASDGGDPNRSGARLVASARADFDPDLSTERWFVETIAQGGVTLSMRDRNRAPLDGMVVWRLVRSLAPGPVSITLVRRDGEAQPRQFTDNRRQFVDPGTGTLAPVYEPGELTQSLCSPWMHDFRDCGCTYWASSHPDIVVGALGPDDETLPSGAPADPLRNRLKIDWLRRHRVPELTSGAMPTNTGNQPLQMAHYEINTRWQDLAVVLEGREIADVYQPRQAASATPFATAAELAVALRDLAGLEHLVAVLYLYAYYSLEPTADAKTWPTLPEDVGFVREQLLAIATSEMQHLRWVNQILWMLADAGLVPDGGPALTRAVEVPPAGTLQVATPASLAPLTAERLAFFAAIEEPSAYIDGRYARVAATLRQRSYPAEIYEIAERILTDGEEHYSRFRDASRVLRRYDRFTPYLRQRYTAAAAEDPRVANALGAYRSILDQLAKAYTRRGAASAEFVIAARSAMLRLHQEAEVLAGQGLGIPFLAVNG